MSHPLTETEILSVPILVEIRNGQLTIRASRKHLQNVKLLLQRLAEQGITVDVKEAGLYCHYCNDHPIFQTEEEWEEHRESHTRFCEWPGCPAVFIPAVYGQVYFCSKHETQLEQGEQPYWRI